MRSRSRRCIALDRAALRAAVAATCALALLGASRGALAQAPVPARPDTAAAKAAAPPSPVSGIRNKISAGDLLSAESVLEVHREKYGEDGPWLQGLGWLARGALLLGDLDKAKLYSAQVRDACSQRIAKGASLDADHDLEIALGAAIETEAQRLGRTSGKAAAAAYLRGELARGSGPVGFRSRLHKRLNMLTLEGTPAPEWVVEDFVGDPPPTLASLRGKPTVLFLWAEGCGDCKAQSTALARVLERHRGSDLRCVAITRYYDDPPQRATEKARVDSVWTAVYSGIGPIPRVLSTASMIEYGVSSTPTFVFVDRRGIVRRYTPTRLTDAELEREVAALLR